MNKKVLSIFLSFIIMITVLIPSQAEAVTTDTKNIYINNVKLVSATKIDSNYFVTLANLKSMFGSNHTFATKSNGIVINGVYVKVQLNSKKYNIRDVVRTLNYSFQIQNENIYIDTTKPYIYSSADGVSELSGHTLPMITIKGEWPCGKRLLKTAWAMYFPIMCKYLGLPTDFFTTGVTWVWDESVLPDTVDFNAATNTVLMGPIFNGQYTNDQLNYNYERLVRQMIHETGHLWIQNEDGSENVGFNFGQWVWEANTMIVEALVDTIYYENSTDNWSAYKYDNTAALGGALNGVLNDGDKYQRSNTDTAAVRSFYIMASTLSKDYTYFAKVNKLRIAWAKEHALNTMDTDSYAKILDEAADGKLIDGLKPSEWLFNQPVANIDGGIGSFLTLFATQPTNNMGYGSGLEVYVNIAAFTRSREDDGMLKEKGVATTVTLKAYDPNGKLVAEEKIKTSSNNSTEYRFDMPVSCKNKVIKIVATAIVGDKKIKALNYVINGFTVGSRGNTHLVFFLTDSTGNVVTNIKEADISISGASTISYSNLSSGYISVTAKKGKTVSMNIHGNKYQYTKPYGSRVITLQLNN